MRVTRSALTSAPFISLYLAAAGAIVLSVFRTSLNSMKWYPVAVGVTAALAIIPLKHLVVDYFERAPAGARRIIGLFAFISLITLAAGVYFIRSEPMLALGMLGMSIIFGWASLGSAFGWPGFRPPPSPDQCPKCRYDLTGNMSGVCPECGAKIDEADGF